MVFPSRCCVRWCSKPGGSCGGFCCLRIFSQGDFEDRGHSNNAYALFEDYALIIDPRSASRAEVVLPENQSATSGPIRCIVDTHHHGNHAYRGFVFSLFSLWVLAIREDGVGILSRPEHSISA